MKTIAQIIPPTKLNNLIIFSVSCVPVAVTTVLLCRRQKKSNCHYSFIVSSATLVAAVTTVLLCRRQHCRQLLLQFYFNLCYTTSSCYYRFIVSSPTYLQLYHGFIVSSATQPEAVTTVLLCCRLHYQNLLLQFYFVVGYTTLSSYYSFIMLSVTQPAAVTSFIASSAALAAVTTVLLCRRLHYQRCYTSFIVS